MREFLRHLKYFFVGAMSLAAIQTFAADSVTLALPNGDRITGHEVKREGGIIHFESDLLGLLIIPEDKAEVTPPPSCQDGTELAAAGAPSGGFPQRAEIPEDEKVEAAPLAVAAAPAPDKPARGPEQATIQRQLDFGLTHQSGRRDRSDLSFRATIERRTKLTELRFQGRYLYGESEGRRVTDNLNSSLRFRRDLSRNLFAQSESKYERDPIKGLDNDFSQSFGMGHNLIERAGLKVALGGGLAGRYRSVESDGSGWAYQVDAFQDLVYTINSHMKISQDLSLQLTPAEKNEYLVKLNTALTGKLTNTLNMSMRYEYEYDRSLVPDARENQRIVTSVGYAF